MHKRPELTEHAAAARLASGLGFTRHRGCRGASPRRAEHARSRATDDRRHGLAQSARDGARAGRDDRDPSRGDRAGAGRRLRRSAAQRPGLERRADERARHQPDGPRRDVDAREHAARAARRPLDLSRLLRLRDVGLAADPSERDRAHRGRARPRQRRLGRERDDRRRQRHRPPAEGHGGHDGRRRHAVREHRARGLERLSSISATRCRRATSSNPPTTGRRARSPARTPRRRTRPTRTRARSKRA